jgi:ketosteroid isomerase-like protein
MSPHKPEDWPRLFEQQLNAGDLEAVVALYEPNASFVPKSGKTVVGHDGIRLMLAELKRTILQVRTKKLGIARPR